MKKNDINDLMHTNHSFSSTIISMRKINFEIVNIKSINDFNTSQVQFTTID